MFQQQSQRYQPAARWLERGLVLAEVLGEECTDWATLRSPNLGPVGTRMRPMPKRLAARGFGSTFGGGTTDMVTTPLTKNSNLRTYIASVYVNGGGGGSLGRIFDKTSTSEYWYIDGADTSMSYVRAYDTNVGGWKSDSTSITAGQYVLAVTYDASSVANDPILYINGLPATTADSSVPVGARIDNSDPLIIGNRTSDGARNFDGLIDRFYAFDSILSAQEIAFLSADMERLWAPRRPFIVYAPSSGTPTAPTFIQEAETAFNSTTSPKGSGNFTTSTGDVVVSCELAENWIDPPDAINATGTNVVLTVQQEIASIDYAGIELRAGVVSSGGTTSVSFAMNGGTTFWFGGNALTFRASDGIGASSKTNASGGPSLDITTTQANSAIVVAVGDWNAADGASRTWRTVNSVTPTSGNGYELTYYRNASRYTAYIAYYPDAGAAGTKTVGLSAPSGQKYSIVALEVKGTAGVGGGASILQQMMAYHH